MVTQATVTKRRTDRLSRAAANTWVPDESANEVDDVPSPELTRTKTYENLRNMILAFHLISDDSLSSHSEKRAKSPTEIDTAPYRADSLGLGDISDDIFGSGTPSNIAQMHGDQRGWPSTIAYDSVAGSISDATIVLGASDLRIQTNIPADRSRVPHREAYEVRIQTLRGYATEDDDVEAVNEDSINDFWSFMQTREFTRRSGLVMLDNGDLRAVWREMEGHEVGIHFPGNKTVIYAIFKRNPDGSDAEPAIGTSSFKDVVAQLEELELLTFVNE